MEQNHFVQSHPLLTFSESDNTDYSDRDRYFIQCLKSMESIMDIDAYIIDFKNQRILYATKGCSTYFGDKVTSDEGSFPGIHFLDSIIPQKDLSEISVINSKVHDFFYSLPPKRRTSGYFTQDFRMGTSGKNSVLINHKGTVLDLTESGVLRLVLCITSIPTSNKPGNAYIKMTDSQTVYGFMPSSKKFVEVKNQKLTSKATKVLKLAGNGKNETQIARELGISVNTVKYHKKRIFAQLGVKNTAEAIHWMNNQKKLVKR
jgi:DNA-binding CsgD family transcriptional regulator